jgi:predicted metal-dependent peptidase
MMSCTIDAIVEDIESSGAGWGSLAGNLAETIIANTKAKIDYRKTLTGFRASILSSKRHLTRMRPNRRSGFENMGSIRRFDTNLLIAVDVSGSISDEVLTHFYSVIGRIFKYGIEHVDVVQFDCSLSEVQAFEKAKKRVEIVGRGGTSFQPIFDFVQKNFKYDGLIIFTDGDAPKPKKPKRFKTKVVWVCEDEKAYQKHKSWMKETGRCCFVQL